MQLFLPETWEHCSSFIRLERVGIQNSFVFQFINFPRKKTIFSVYTKELDVEPSPCVWCKYERPPMEIRPFHDEKKKSHFLGWQGTFLARCQLLLSSHYEDVGK